MLDLAISAVLVLSIIFLVYEIRRFGNLHAKKYELPTEKIWEKFVGLRPEDMADSDLTMKMQKLENRISHLEDQVGHHKKLSRKLIEELGK